MPLYDFECPHGHRFEKMVSMSECNDAVPCEGQVPQIQLADAPDIGELPVAMVPCALKATTVITHSNPAGSLDHGSSSNRDAAREGRYDPLNPSRRFMAKGRGYRK
jgi:putative FmdB family regulatory protein